MGSTIIDVHCATCNRKITLEEILADFHREHHFDATELAALQAARGNVRESLNEGGRSGIGSRKQGRVRRVLVIAEVALALVLLVGSGLMVRSFIKLRQVDVGFTAHMRPFEHSEVTSGTLEVFIAIKPD